MTLAIRQSIMLSFWVSQTNLNIEFKLSKKRFTTYTSLGGITLNGDVHWFSKRSDWEGWKGKFWFVCKNQNLIIFLETVKSPNRRLLRGRRFADLDPGGEARALCPVKWPGRKNAQKTRGKRAPCF